MSSEAISGSTDAGDDTGTVVAVPAPRPAGSERSLLRASVAPVVGTTLSRATGLVRVAALTSALGLTTFADVYNLANTTPNILYELVLGGVLSSTLVPLFVRTLDDPEDDTASAVVTVAFAAITAVTVVMVLLSPLINRLFAAPLSGAARVQQLAYGDDLLALLLPQILFYGLTTLATALLTARRRFGPPAFTPVLTNLVTAAAAVATGWMLTRSGRPTQAEVYVIGLGTTAGVAAMAIALVPYLRSTGIHLRWTFQPRHPAVRSVVRLSGWMLGFTACNQVALLVVLTLARTQAAGSVSAYQYAFIFFQLPHGLIAVSLMTAVLPELATAAVDGDERNYREKFREGLSLLLTFLLPGAIALALLGRPAIELLLQRGRFDAADTTRTLRMLVGFAVGLPAFSVFLYCVRAFFARKDTRTPFFLNLAENTVNVVLVVPFMALLGAPGLSLAYSAAYWLAAVAALVVLNRRVPHLLTVPALVQLLRPVAVALVTGIGLGGAVLALRSRDVGAVVELLGSLAVGAAAFVAGVLVVRPRGTEALVDRLLPASRSRGGRAGRAG